jgi:uncharacterized protein (DUF433 family)
LAVAFCFGVTLTFVLGRPSLCFRETLTFVFGETLTPTPPWKGEGIARMFRKCCCAAVSHDFAHNQTRPAPPPDREPARAMRLGGAARRPGMTTFAIPRRRKLWHTSLMTEDLLARITVEPDKMGGRPCIRRMRIRVMDILDMLADGATRADILASYPELEDEDISAALAYASRATDHRVIAAE